MVGGKIVEVIREPERIFLNVQDTAYQKDRCGQYVVRNADSEAIRVGDAIWWQGKNAFWTSADRRVIERNIPRASCSGINHPYGKEVLEHSLLV